jgi:hypothetical protein
MATTCQPADSRYSLATISRSLARNGRRQEAQNKRLSSAFKANKLSVLRFEMLHYQVNYGTDLVSDATGY